MKIPTIRKKTRAVFAMALMLCFLVLSHAGILFAAAPTVTTDPATGIGKTYASLNLTISDDGNKPISEVGFEYGQTVAYGNIYTTDPFSLSGDILTSLLVDIEGSANGELSGPFGVAEDAGGNIYVADSGNNRIQKFDSSGVYQSQFGSSGSGNGQFNSPFAVAFDSSGNIFVSDYGNNRIQKFDSSGVYQSQFGSSGSGNGQFQDPTGISFDSTGNIYVADSGNNRIQKFDSSGVYQSQFGSSGSGNGQFSIFYAGRIAFDSTGNIYVADSGNNRIQKFDSSGVYQSQFGIIGNGEGEFDVPIDIEIDEDDVIYVLDSSNERIQKFDLNGTFIAASFGPADFYAHPHYADFFIDSQKDLIILQRDDVVLFRLSQTNILDNQISSLTCNTTYHYRAFATNADGTSYGNDATFTTSACDVPTVSTDISSLVNRTTATLNGTQLADGVAPSSVRGFEYGTSTSYGTTVSSPGSLSVLQFGFQGDSEGAFESPYGIALDTSENIYVSDTGNNRIQKFDPDGNFLTMLGWGVAGGGGLENCTSSCVAGSSGSGNGELNAPRGLQIDSSGNINIADTGNNRIQKFNSLGVFVTKFGTLGSGASNLSGPSDIGFEYGTTTAAALDTGNNRVRICPAFICGTTDFGSSILSAPEAMDRAGLFVADTGNNRILKFGPNTQGVSVNVSYTTDIGGMSGPKGVASKNNGSLVYVSDTGHDRLLKFASTDPAATGTSPVTLKFISQFGTTGASSGEFNSPSHIVVNDDGEVFVADTGNHRVQKLSPFFSENITGLACGTLYHYRAFATNTDGTGYGSDSTFTTSNCGSSSSGSGPTPRYGCTDNHASNWDPIANTDDGTCQFLGCTNPVAINYNLYALVDDGSCDLTVYQYGCTDPLADNYSVTNEIDDGSCTYGGPVLGCTNPLALNYNPLATTDNGSCDLPGGGPDDTYGCTDSFADNYDSQADVDDGSCEYTLPPGTVVGCTDNDALNYNASATSDDGSCTYEPPPIWPPIKEIIDIITEVTGWTPEQQADIYKPVAVAGLVVPSVWLLLANRSALVSIPLRLWNLIPTLLGFRRKRRPWGTVYDSVTKQPLDPVYVRLYDSVYAEVATSITDLDGRYGFAPAPGTYTIDAKKGDYVFPSVKLKDATRDELYDDLYFGEKLEIEQEDAIITKNIPMDAVNFNWNEFEKGKRAGIMKFYSKGELFLSRIAKILFIAGFASSILLAAIEPRTFNFIILGIYVAIFILSLFGVRPRQPGYVVERGTGVPLSFGILSVFSAVLGKEVGHTIVGATGRYHILVPKGRYFVKLRKKTGEQTYEEIYTSDVFKARNGYIDKVIKV